MIPTTIKSWLRRLTAATLVAFLLLTLFNCGPKKNMVYLEKNDYQQAVSQAVYQGTRLQTGDLLDIKVSAFDEFAVRPFNQATMYKTASPNEVLNNTTNQNAPQGYLVDADGYISFPVLGRLHVAGLGRQQLQEDLEGRLKAYLTDPMVTVRQLNFNVTVLGEVNKPGQYTSDNEKINLFQALGLAGDMTQYGDRTNVKLVRNVNGTEQTYTLDFTDAGLTKSPVYYLQQNDVLYVQPDETKKVVANTNPNRTLVLSLVGVGITLASLLINAFK